MGISSIAESDNTSDFIADVVGNIMEKMKVQLNETSNEFNTPGYIDVALSLKSLISKDNEFHFTYKEQQGEFWDSLYKKFDDNWKVWESNSELNKEYNALFKWVKKMRKVTQNN